MLCALPAWAQLNDNTIAITVSQSATLAPDQVVFSIDISSGLGTGFDTVLNALAGSGIGAANFTGASTNGQGLLDVVTRGPLMIDWNFSWAVPLANMKFAVQALTEYQQNFSQAKQGLSLSFSVAGFQVSPQLQQMQSCSVSGLLAVATAQAQKFGAAAGLTVGPVVSMSGASSSPAAGLGCTMTVTFARQPAVAVLPIIGGTVTVTAARSLPSQADESALSVSLQLPATSTLDNAVSALSGTGITASNFASVSGDAQALIWTFNLVVPFSQLQSTLSALSGLQQKLNANGLNGLTSLSFSQSNLESSVAGTCPYAGLVSDARSQAMSLASSAGLSLGPILAVSDGSAASGVAGATNTPAYAFYSLGATFGVFASITTIPPTPACTLSMQFQVNGSGANPQTLPESITVSGAVNTIPAADQALFYVSVTAPLSMTLDDVLAEIAGSGITAADLSSQPLALYIPGVLNASFAPTVSWPFTLAVPLSTLQQTISTLTALQTKIGNASAQSDLYFYVEGLQTSSQALAAQSCSPSDILNNARSKAQSIATAAGLSLGPVVAISNVAGSSGCTAAFKFAANGGQ